MKSLHVFLLRVIVVVTLLAGGTLHGHAQRLHHQKGLSLFVGTPAVEKFPRVFERQAYTLSFDMQQYLWRNSYLFYGIEYRTRNYATTGYSVPVRNYLAHVGFMYPLLYDYTRTALLYVGVAGAGGYQHVDSPEILSNGATLLTQSHFIGGAEAHANIEVLVTNSLILAGGVKGSFLWGSDLHLFYPSLSVGLKYLF